MNESIVNIYSHKPSPEIEALAEKSQAGDNEAFTQLYTLYYQVILNFHRKATGSDIIAQDLTSDTFYRFLRSTCTAGNTGFLFALAKSSARDYFRSNTRHKVIDIDECDTVASDEPGPEQSVIKNESYTELEAALKLLTKDEQKVFTYRLVYNLPHKDIAALLQKKPNSYSHYLPSS